MFTSFLHRLVTPTWDLVLLILSAALALMWKGFHPGNATPVPGPRGESNRAFIENRSIGDLCFVLCISDWPHTFGKPVSLGAAVGSEGPAGRVFWSLDGGVIAVCEDIAHSAWVHGSAYDFKNHQVVRYDSGRIAALLASRGGVGPEHDSYPDGKGGYRYQTTKESGLCLLDRAGRHLGAVATRAVALREGDGVADPAL